MQTKADGRVWGGAEGSGRMRAEHGGVSLTEEPAPGTPVPDTTGAAISTPHNNRGPPKGWRGLCKDQFSIAKQEKSQRGKEDTDAGVPCPWCHTVPVLGTIPSGSCWTKSPFPGPGASQGGFWPGFPAVAGDSVDVAPKSSNAEWWDHPSLSVTGHTHRARCPRLGWMSWVRMDVSG